MFVFFLLEATSKPFLFCKTHTHRYKEYEITTVLDIIRIEVKNAFYISFIKLVCFVQGLHPLPSIVVLLCRISPLKRVGKGHRGDVGHSKRTKSPIHYLYLVLYQSGNGLYIIKYAL